MEKKKNYFKPIITIEEVKVDDILFVSLLNEELDIFEWDIVL